MKRNIVVLVMVPSLVIIHLGWIKIQNTPALVNPLDKRELPIVEAAVYLKTKIVDKFSSTSDTK